MTKTMTRILLTSPLTLLLLLAPSLAVAQPKHDVYTHVAIGTYAFAGYLDGVQTAYCRGENSCREVNPVMSWMMGRDQDRAGTVRGLAVKGVWHVAVTSFLIYDHHRHPTRTKWVAWSLAAVQAAVVVHNGRRTRERP